MTDRLLLRDVRIVDLGATTRVDERLPAEASLVDLHIVDGKLTGKVITPVVMTGYVPDLLGSISMVSGDREVFGNGMCGKGHKEWVKVADGGPYLKAKARLG